MATAFTEHALANRPKLCGTCAIPQNFHARKLGEIMVFVSFGIFKKSRKKIRNFNRTGLLGSIKLVDLNCKKLVFVTINTELNELSPYF